MTTWITLIALMALFTQPLRGEFGEKVKTITNSTIEAADSYEEYYYDSAEEKQSTTPDDGVVIEKAILAAEITPKASYYLVEPPRGSSKWSPFDESESPDLTKATFTRNPPSSTYSDASDSNFVTQFGTSAAYLQSTTPLSTTNSFQSSIVGSDIGNAQNSFQVQELPYFPVPGWSLYKMNIDNQPQQKTFSSSYSNSNDMEIISAEEVEIENNGIGLSDDGSYDPYKNGDYLHLGIQDTDQQKSWNTFSTPASPGYLEQHEKDKYILEKNRLSQIEKAQYYLKQVEAAQEYALKVKSLQDKVQEGFESFKPKTSGWSLNPIIVSDLSTEQQPTVSTVVAKTAAPGVADVSSKHSYQWMPVYAPEDVQSHAIQVNTLEGWTGSLTQDGHLPRTNIYSGPTATPVVLPSGFLADTDEVTKARIAHLQALKAAIESAALWKDQSSKRWS